MSEYPVHGIDPATDVKAVIISHLHHDHGDGLADVRDAPIYVSREHWHALANPLQATAPRCCAPALASRVLATPA